MLTVSAACTSPPPPLPPSDPELREELGIPDEVPIHRINLSGRGDETRIVPSRIEIARGEIVQIVVVDRRTHLITFDVEGMEPALLAFLKETRQDRFPPLLEREARIVLSFEGAPPGRYTFIDEGNGPPTRGEILVSEP